MTPKEAAPYGSQGPFVTDQRPIVILGNGPAGRFAVDICASLNIPVRGFFADYPSTHPGVPLLGALNEFGRIDPGGCRFYVALGNGALRIRYGGEIEAKGGELATLIHPLTTISFNVRIGKGVLVNAYSYLHADSVVEDHAMVENHCSIGTAVKLERGSTVTTGCMINAMSVVGPGAFIGSGSVVNPTVLIGAGALIGAGSVVTENVPPQAKAYGVPARVSGTV